MFITWKNNVLVLFITSVKGEKNKVILEKKRPSETSISAKIARKPFGDKPIVILDIPSFANKFNHKIDAIDKGNQLKA
jgi:hypothetical protein